MSASAPPSAGTPASSNVGGAPPAKPAKNRRWVVAQADLQATEALARAAVIPPLLAQLLVARGVRTEQQARLFFAPSIEQLLDPFSMADMTIAVGRLQKAILAREPILIYGDYDVDGTVAVVLLKTAIEIVAGAAGSDIRFHVPHRLREGYGMKSEVVEAAVATGARLIISVDTGIRAFAAAEAAAALGIDLIVTDHHLPDASRGLPAALAVLNPNRQDCLYACKHLCGAGVAFKLAQALLEAHDATRAGNKILPSFLKLLAIATVADAVPLLGENRTIVALGLEELTRPIQPGLRALLDLAKLDPSRRRLTSTDIAFRLAPRINAAGRMDIAAEVVEMFTTRDAERARSLAEKLNRLNQDRRNTESEVLADIEACFQSDPGLCQAPCIIVDQEGWHRGVIGILASRIVERTNRPAMVIAHENGEAHGSGRSIPGFHLLQAIESCQELFTRFGGHAHAVGFSLPSALVPELRARLQDYAALHLSAESLDPALFCDAQLPLDKITAKLYAWLQQLHPVGMGNEEPLFVAYRVRIAAPPLVLKERHVKLHLAIGDPGKTIPALGWRWAERFTALGVAEGSWIDLVYRLRHNDHAEYGGVEIEIEDLRLAGTAA